jgi:hypothetical protein
MARPRKPEGARGHGTAVRLTERERAYLEAAARMSAPDGLDIGLSAFMRVASLRHAANVLGAPLEKWQRQR